MAPIRPLALLSAFAVLLLSSSARADQVATVADLVCSPHGDVAVIRFGLAWNGDPPSYQKLPASEDDGLSSAPPTPHTDCTLASGRRIRIRIGDKQAFPYGQGGGDPPSFFSLWIDGRVVLSRREWKPGYGAVSPWTAGVVIRGDRLIFCRGTRDDDNNPDGPLRCSSERFDLMKARLDRVEYPPAGHKRPPPGTFLIAAGSKAPALCKRFLRGIGHAWPDLLSGVNKTPFDLDLKMRKIEARPAWLSVATASLRPGGPTYRIAVFSDTSGPFDGDLAVLAPAKTSDAALAQLGPEIEATVMPPPPPGWGYISGGRPGIYPKVQAQYVHLLFVQIDGVVHVLAHPTNQSEKPAAMLLAFGPDLAPRPACAFDEVGLNFG
jgi:hypothetical protein